MAYNKKQTEWRRNILRYIANLESFKTDLVSGKIDLEKWGLVAKKRGSTVRYDLAEDLTNRAGGTSKPKEIHR